MQHAPDRPMTRKKPPEHINTGLSLRATLGSVTCPSCESLERQYDDAIRHIRSGDSDRHTTKDDAAFRHPHHDEHLRTVFDDSMITASGKVAALAFRADRAQTDRAEG